MFPTLTFDPTDVEVGDAVSASLSALYPISSLSCTYSGGGISPGNPVSFTLTVGSNKTTASGTDVIDTSLLSAATYTASCAMQLTESTPTGWGLICNCTPGPTIQVDSNSNQATFTVSEEGSDSCEGGYDPNGVGDPSVDTSSPPVAAYTWQPGVYVVVNGVEYDSNYTVAANGTTADAGVKDCTNTEVTGTATAPAIQQQGVSYDTSGSPTQAVFQWITTDVTYDLQSGNCTSCDKNPSGDAPSPGVQISPNPQTQTDYVKCEATPQSARRTMRSVR